MIGWITLPCSDCRRLVVVLLSPPMFCTAALCNIVNNVSIQALCLSVEVFLHLCCPLCESLQHCHFATNERCNPSTERYVL
jgi:hypothetical protein